MFVSLTSYSKAWVLFNANLEIKFDDQTALLTVKDKRCSKVWQQSAFAEKMTARSAMQKGNTLSVSFSGKYPFNVDFTLIESALNVSISANADMPFADLAFPSAFKTPGKNHYLLSTESEGVLVPVDDAVFPMGEERIFFCGGGTAMAWMGVTDTAFKSGYMAIVETPYDVRIRSKREAGLITFEPVWMPSMEKFGYTRKVVYHFFDKGGYVAQCKKYRDYIWKKNNVITLKENEKKTPALAKMIGAVHLYVWDNARDVSFAKEMKVSGIEKALFLWDANHTPYPEIGYDTKLKELGYATGAYELFTDLKLRDTAMYTTDEAGPMRFGRTTYPGLFNQLSIKRKEGKTVSNQFGHTSNPVAIRPQMTKRIERELKEFPHEAYFLDVYAANGLFEDYDPQHPLTRQQFAEAVVQNYKMIAEKYGQYMGGEWGADYLGSNSVFSHGIMTLHRTWWGTEIGEKGSIYWTGDWKNNARPSQMLGTRVAPDKYLKYSINEYTRVPLYELVYHDAMITSWRWEDGNHHAPAIWWKKDLFNILYGTAPLWNLDRETWTAFKNTFVKSYQNICPWLQQIAYDEMISHRFISADHKVQETVFSSGKKAVVNFGDNEFMYEGKTIEAKGFITLDESNR